ncbi:phage tail length tape measure family protein [Caulobacter segnis]
MAEDLKDLFKNYTQVAGAADNFVLSNKKAMDSLLKLGVVANDIDQNFKKTFTGIANLDRVLSECSRSTDPFARALRGLEGRLQGAAGGVGLVRSAVAGLETTLSSSIAKQDATTKSHRALGQAAKTSSDQIGKLGGALSGAALGAATGDIQSLIGGVAGIAEVFVTASADGIGFGAVLAGLAAEAAPIIAIAAPLAIVGGLLALGVDRALENEAAVRKFTGELALNSDGLNYNAGMLATTARELSRYGVTAEDARRGLSKFVKDGVDPTRLKDFSVAAKSLSEVLGGDVGPAQDTVAKAFTAGFSAVESLNREVNFLTGSQYLQIESMFQAGKTAEAQALAFDLFADHVNKAADKVRGPWGEAARELSGAWDGFLERLADTDAIRGAVAGLEGLMGLASGVLNGGDKNKGGKDRNYDPAPKYRAMPILNPADPFGAAYNVFAYIGSEKRREADRNALIKGVGDIGRGTVKEPKLTPEQLKFNELKEGYVKQRIDPSKRSAEDRMREAGDEAFKNGQDHSIKDPALLNQLREEGRKTEAQRIKRENEERAKRANRVNVNIADRSQSEERVVGNFVKDALERAQKDHLAAEMALTGDVRVLAGYKKRQIAAEAEAAKADLDTKAANQKTAPAELEAAKAKIDDVAALKAKLVDQQLAGQLVEKEIQQRSVLAGFNDRTIQAQIAMAGTLEDAQALEQQALEERQARESKDTIAKQRIQIGNETLDPAAALAANSAMLRAQEAERAAKALRDQRALVERDLSLSQADHQNTVSILTSRKALAQSEYEAGRTDLEILDEQHVARREALEAVTRANGYSRVEVDLAQKNLPVLEATYRNERKALELSASKVKAYSDLVQAISGMSQSIVNGDVGGSISGLSGVLKKTSGLIGSTGGLGKALGTAGNFLGPVGSAVSAVTGVLGAIGQRSAEKAQAKLAELNKGVEDLRTANMTSSNSIAGALEEGNRNWNGDLEYSSEMLVALRSIDNQIGALASSISQSIAAGKLMSTAGLAIGKTGGGGLFGSSSNTELLDQGLTFNPTTYGALDEGGLTGSTYADLVTTKTKKFLGVTTGVKVSTSSVSGAIDGDLLSQVAGVIQRLGDGVLAAASVFGEEAGGAAKQALETAQIDIGKLSLKGLSSEEIEKLLNATFSKVGDDLAKAGVPGLEKLADVGEGAFETLIRLAREYEVVDISLSSIGMTFKTVGLQSLAARDALVEAAGGLDAFTSQTAFFAEHFLNEDQRLKPVQDSFSKELTRLKLPADLTREGFAKTVLDLDVSTKAGAELYAAMMKLAPAFDKVATAAENAQKAVADKKISIQDQIDELVMSPTELLNKSRAKEQKAVEDLDASLVPLLKNLWDLQDAAEAAKLAIDKSNMLADLAEAQGQTEVAKRMRRDLALAQIKDPEMKRIQQQVWAAQDAAEKVSAARDVLTQAYEKERDALELTKDKFEELSTSLRAFSASLSDTIAGTDPGARYRRTRETFLSTAAMARLGDPDAMGRLQNEGEAFTAASRDYVSTSLDYLRDVGLVRSAVDEAADTADRQASIAEQQLETLNRSVQGLIEINASVVSVAQAIASLQAANQAAATAGVVSVGGQPVPAAQTNSPSTPPLTNAQKELNNAAFWWGLTNSDMGRATANDPSDVNKYAQGMAAKYTPGYMDIVNSQGIAAANALVDAGKLTYTQGGSLKFATGGSFEVGGAGPPDSKLFNLALSPGEAVNVQRADQKSDKSLINELRRLREEFADLRATSVRIANSNDKMERTLTNVTEGGRAMQTQATA